MTRSEKIAKMFKTDLLLGIEFEPSTEQDDEKLLLAMITAKEIYGDDFPTLRYIVTLSEYIDRLETALHNANVTIVDQLEKIMELESK